VATPPGALSRRPLGYVATVASVLVLVALVALMGRVHMQEPRLAAVEDPERALALIVAKTMDMQAALAEAPAWERHLYTLTMTETTDEIGQAIAWYEELADDSLAPSVDLRLAILLGEAGRNERLERVVGQWPSRGVPLAVYGATVAAAYLGTDELDVDGVRETLAALGRGWFADALAIRVAARVDEPALGDAARQALAARARQLLWRVRALAAVDAVLLGGGLVAVAAAWRQRRRVGQRAVADAALPPPWSLGAGLATLVRGGALAALVLLLLLVGNHWLVEQPVLAEALDQPLMYLPLLLLVWRALLAPAGLTFVTAFGLRPRPDGRHRCLLAAAGLVAAGIAIDLVLGLLGDQLGFVSHWTEWFDAELAWGPPASVLVTLVGSVLFAPVFEELIFRGLLYGTLRTRLAWPAAALGSALVFALAHGYGIAGFLSVLFSGILWAWVYERTGSLLPCVIAHVVNNVAVALTLVALLR
jgi:membrane protease YdiL (CAAX protease family)